MTQLFIHNCKNLINCSIEEAEQYLLGLQTQKSDTIEYLCLKSIIEYLQKGCQKSETTYNNCVDNLKDKPKILIEFYFLHSEFAIRQNDINKALEIFQKIKNHPLFHKKETTAKYHFHLGNFHARLLHYEKAVEEYRKSYRIRSELQQELKTAEIYNALGRVMELMKQFPDAISNYEESLRIRKKYQDQSGISKVLNNLGVIYYHLDDLKRAETFYQEALTIKKAIQDQQGIANLLTNIGLLEIRKGNLEEAEKLYLTSFELRKKLKQNDLIGNSLLNLGLLYVKKNDFSEAEIFFDKAMKVADRSQDKQLKMRTHKALSHLFEEKEDFKSAYANYHLYSELYSSFLEQNNQTRIHNLIKKMDAERKQFEEELFKQKLESEKKVSQLTKQMHFFQTDYNLISKQISNRWNLQFIGDSEVSKKILSDVKKVGASPNTNVLICGESGVGKEIIAELIHRVSIRKEKPFFALNCAAIPEQLLESELFGYVKGAFTNATKDKHGVFESCHGGTLFLDEIGEMPPTLQTKLLRVIDQQKCRRIGSTHEIHFDVRILSATNRHISEMLDRNYFRNDLYQRIATYEIKIPPLRKRKKDILPLTYHFLQFFSKEMKIPIPILADDIQKILLSYSFPGNVRELKNMIERAMINCNDGFLKKEDLQVKSYSKSERKENFNLESNEIQIIKEALKDDNFNQTSAAKKLGISRQALYRKIKKYQINLQ